MGSGISKYALIINGGMESKYLANVDRSLRVLEDAGYESFVASSEVPDISPDDFVCPSYFSVESLIEKLREKIDDDDELLIYVTGNGGLNTGEATIALADGDYGELLGELLDDIPFGKRTVIMDQCYGGNWGRFFLDDPMTLFMSAGSSDEARCYDLFAPYFWGNKIPDLNGDRTISWQERFAEAIERGAGDLVSPQFSVSPGYIQEGKPPFSREVTFIDEREGFERELGRLEPGQYAVAMFTMDHCPPCDAYKPVFKGMARAMGGQHDFMIVKNMDILSAYGFSGAPTVMVFDHKGTARRVNDKLRIFEEMAMFEFKK